MSSGYNCYFQFSFNTDNNKLTLILDEVENHEIEDTGIEESKTIVLTDPLDIEKSKQEAIGLINSMMPAGKVLEDLTPLIDSFLGLMNKIKENDTDNKIDNLRNDTKEGFRKTQEQIDNIQSRIDQINLRDIESDIGE